MAVPLTRRHQPPISHWFWKGDQGSYAAALLISITRELAKRFRRSWLSSRPAAIEWRAVTFFGPRIAARPRRNGVYFIQLTSSKDVTWWKVK